MKPNHLGYVLVVGCNISHTPCFLHVREWEIYVHLSHKFGFSGSTKQNLATQMSNMLAFVLPDLVSFHFTVRHVSAGSSSPSATTL